ncbi:MAG: nitroreductase family protein [Paramuribaculum sp.]|nr:nitroreductase family protein [Paramuribaculum sp.]
MNTKSVSETLLQRRSIRRYEYTPATNEQMQFIYEAISNTPTSYNAQQYSVIDISDPDLKLKLYELTGQKQIKTCSHFLVFCADFQKISQAAKAKQLEMPEIYNTADGLILGTVDASLAMMSAVTAAASLGLGTCCIGYARTANPAAISELLQLPDHVYVVCGLAIGVPRELPDLKPKQPQSLIIHHNHYRTDSMASDLMNYDTEVTEYNATRSGSKTTNDWTGHMLDYYQEALNYNMLEALKHRGFNPKK